MDSGLIPSAGAVGTGGTLLAEPGAAETGVHGPAGTEAARPDPYPGDTHWYDLPDDDADPEEDDEDPPEPVSWWHRWRHGG
jgi:hypothetical protein